MDLRTAIAHHFRNVMVDDIVEQNTNPWTIAFKLSMKSLTEHQQPYFLKCAEGASGLAMLEGEKQSLVEISQYSPSLVPKVHDRGRLLHTSPPMYFLLLEFLDLKDETPDSTAICARVAELHIKSTSPNGKFGFFAPTYQGPIPNPTAWEGNWSRYFRRMILSIHRIEIANNGRNESYEKTFENFVEYIVPEVLSPLQSEERILKPVLVHGDLWPGNVGLSGDQRQVVIFDSAAMYAHNEFELGMWRHTFNASRGDMYEQYQKFIKPSPPENQFDDRNRLYSVKFLLVQAAAQPKLSVRNRRIIGDDIRYLAAKYEAV